MTIRTKTTSKGFTLIELLVVIAIIGLLAGIVLVSLGGARQQARDARIITDMGQYRSAAEIQFTADNNYDDVGIASDFTTLSSDMSDQGGVTFLVATTDITGAAGFATHYCAEVQLNDGDWYCVDSAFRSDRYTSAPVCDTTGTATARCE